MLQIQTVEPATLDVLKKLLSLPELSSFLLVGGTALSLRYGHRRSVDLDLFSTENFASDDIIPAIEKEFSTFTYRSNKNPIGFFGYIDGIKVDFVRYHHHPLVEVPVLEDGIRFISTPDIAAMKINSIMKRGVKKDFWDIA